MNLLFRRNDGQVYFIVHFSFCLASSCKSAQIRTRDQIYLYFLWFNFVSLVSPKRRGEGWTSDQLDPDVLGSIFATVCKHPGHQHLAPMLNINVVIC